jgi:effector-binding domain-containing protein
MAADPEYRIGEVDVQTVAPFTYASVHTRTTLAKLQDTLHVLMPKIQAAVAKGAVHPSGAMVFTYNGATGDPNQEFDLRIGFFVDRAVTAGSSIDSSDEPAMKCATLIYRGSVTHLKEAFGKLYGEIGARGLVPTAVSREIYLYWEGPDSSNNIIQ